MALKDLYADLNSLPDASAPDSFAEDEKDPYRRIWADLDSLPDADLSMPPRRPSETEGFFPARDRFASTVAESTWAPKPEPTATPEPTPTRTYEPLQRQAPMSSMEVEAPVPSAPPDVPERAPALARGFISGLAQSNPQTTGEALEALGNLVGSGFARRKGAELKAIKLDENSPYQTEGVRLGDLWDGSMGDRIEKALSFVGEQAGQGLASTVPAVLAGAAGAGVGSLLGPEGTAIGAAGGAALPSYTLNMGDLYSSLKEEGMDPQGAARSAAIGALFVSAIDVGALGGVFKTATQPIRQRVFKEIARQAVKRGGINALIEGGGEAIQQIIQESMGEALGTKEVGLGERAQRVAEAGVAGALVGGAFGGAGAVVEGAKAPGADALNDADLAAIDQQVRATSTGRGQATVEPESAASPAPIAPLAPVVEPIADATGRRDPGQPVSVGRQMVEVRRAIAQATSEDEVNAALERYAVMVDQKLVPESTLGAMMDLANRQGDHLRRQQAQSGREAPDSAVSTEPLPARSPRFEEAKNIVATEQHASISQLQRRLKIPYGDAGRLMDELEAAGVVGPADGANPRRILVTAPSIDAKAGRPGPKAPVGTPEGESVPNGDLPGAGQPAPIQEMGVKLPSGLDEMDIPPFDVETLVPKLQEAFNLNPRQAEDVAATSKAFAAGYARRTGKPAEDWYRTYLADVRAGRATAIDAEGRGLLQDANAAPVFYSQVRQVVESKMSPRMQPQQLLAMIEKTPGVKAEELDWLGLREWLAEKKGPVTKEEVAAFLDENEVQVREVVRGDIAAEEELRVTKNDLGKWEIRTIDGDINVGTHDTEQGAYNAIAAYRRVNGGPKFSQYTLPGGENYRELLLTLPGRPASLGLREREAAASRRQRDAMDRLDRVRDTPEEADVRRELSAANAEWNRANQEAAAASHANNYRSSHFDEPNILAHVRFDDRTDAEGNRVLMVQEVQSDWHQAGRKQGYLLPEADRQRLDARRQQIEALGSEATPEQRKEWGDIKNALQGQGNAVPSAPFKSTWPELAMKRVLRWAAENGYDKVAWPSTAEQVARVESWPEITTNEEGQHFTVGDTNVTPIVNRYLQDIPRYLGKYAKKWDARVGQAQVEGAPGEQLAVNVIDITPAMRESVMRGQPLFQRPGEARQINPGDLPKGMATALRDGRALLVGLQAADVSTALHEFVHIYTATARNEGWQDDIAAMESFAGVKDGVWAVEHWEAVARAAERYFRDGKAPSPTLKAAFERFRGWLTEIYRTIKGSPIDQRITPELRQTFDRWFVGDDAVAPAASASVSEAAAPAGRPAAPRKIGQAQGPVAVATAAPGEEFQIPRPSVTRGEVPATPPRPAGPRLTRVPTASLNQVMRGIGLHPSEVERVYGRAGNADDQRVKSALGKIGKSSNSLEVALQENWDGPAGEVFRGAGVKDVNDVDGLAEALIDPARLFKQYPTDMAKAAQRAAEERQQADTEDALAELDDRLENEAPAEVLPLARAMAEASARRQGTRPVEWWDRRQGEVVAEQDQAAEELAPGRPMQPTEAMADEEGMPTGEAGRQADAEPFTVFQSAAKAGADPAEAEAAKREWREKGTESRWFKWWFGDSKVVDEAGKPLVVYHSTDAKITAFDPAKTQDGNLWFTADRGSIESGESGATGRSRIMPVYLKAEKLAGWDEYEKYTTDQLIQQGYDGIKLGNDYLVFDGRQVKSTGNRGTFDLTKKNILYQAAQRRPPSMLDDARAIQAAVRGTDPQAATRSLWDAYLHDREAAGEDMDAYPGAEWAEQYWKGAPIPADLEPEIASFRAWAKAVVDAARQSEQIAPEVDQHLDVMLGKRRPPRIPNSVEGDADTFERSLPKTLEAAGRPGGEDATYRRISNDETEAKVRARIAKEGVDAVAVYALSEDKPSADHTAAGLGVIAARQGQAEELRRQAAMARANNADPAEVERLEKAADEAMGKSVEMASVLSERLTRLGQAVQAVRLVRRLSPEGLTLWAERRVKALQTPEAPGKAPVRRAPLTTEEAGTLSSMARNLQSWEGVAEHAGALRVAARNLGETPTPAQLEMVRKAAEGLRAELRRYTPEEPAKPKKGRPAPAWTQLAEARLSQAEAAAMQRLKDRGIVLSVGMDPRMMADLAIVGAARLAKGGVRFAGWAQSMAQDFPQVAADQEQLGHLYAASRRQLRDMRRQAAKAHRLLTKIDEKFGKLESPSDVVVPEVDTIRERIAALQGLGGQKQVEASRQVNAELNRLTRRVESVNADWEKLAGQTALTGGQAALWETHYREALQIAELVSEVSALPLNERQDAQRELGKTLKALQRRVAQSEKLKAKLTEKFDALDGRTKERAQADVAAIGDAVEALNKLSDDKQAELSLEILGAIDALKPATFGQKVATTYHMIRLLNPKTIVMRNPISNEIFYRMNRLRQATSALLDWTVTGKGKERQITFEVQPFMQGEFWANWLRGSRMALQGQNPGALNTTDLPGSLTFRGKGFTQRQVEKLTKKKSQREINIAGMFERALGAGLRGFDYAAFERGRQVALAEAAELAAVNQGITRQKNLRAKWKRDWIADADQLTLDAAREVGLYVTFQNDGLAAQVATGAQKGLRKAGRSDIWLLPYAKTPANLLSVSLEYSPAGFVRSLYLLSSAGLNKARKLPADPRARAEILQSVSAALVGTAGLTGLGAYLALKGLITAPEDDPEARRLMKEQQGVQGYQINLSGVARWLWSPLDDDATKRQPGDTLYSYDWLQPLALPVTAGAAGVLKYQKGEVGKTVMGLVEAVGGSVAAGLAAFGDQPMLQGVERLAGSYPGETGDEKIERVLGGFLTDLPAGLVPSIINQARQTLDNAQRETWAPTVLQRAINKAMARLPFFSKDLPPVYKTLGIDEVQEVYQDGRNGLFNVFLNPGFVAEYKIDPLVEMLLQPMRDAGETAQFPRIQKGRQKLGKEDLNKQYGGSPFEEGAAFDLEGTDKAEMQRLMARDLTLRLQELSPAAMSRAPIKRQMDALSKRLNASAEVARKWFLVNRAKQYLRVGQVKGKNLPSLVGTDLALAP